jgi:PAS domain S-box-containing protein
LNQITEIKDKLEENERLYRLVSENSQDFIALHLPDGKYTYVSPSVKTILGYEPEELMGTTGLMMVHPDDAESVQISHQHALSGKTLLNSRFRLRKKDSNYVWVDCYTKPIQDETGKVISIQTSSRDITLQKEFENQIIHAKEQAEAATKAKSQFLSTMSHEIRTPMNAVIGLTHLLLQNEPRPDQIDNLNLLKFSGENLLTIINDILDFSKIEAEKLTLEYINFKLLDLVTTIVNIHSPKARDKGIRLDFDFDKNTPSVVLGDPVRLNQIITNLLSNAIKFTNYGSVKLLLKSERSGDKHHRIRFIVRDTGVGIPNEKLVAIFDSFSQANNEITRKFGGTGLGLTISKRLADMMAGQISVESILNKGSIFEFTLVMEEGQTIQELKTNRQRTGGELSEKNRVLLVEDNHVNQVVAVSFLTKWNIEVDCVDNGALSLDKIKSKSYDLVLMDLEMPEMDGYSATVAIRKMEDDYFKAVPILALTASAMSEVRDRVLASGMNDLLTKPFNPDELYDKIRSMIAIDDRDADDNKTLSVKLDVYADGNLEFKRELAGLIIENLKELQIAINQIKTADGVTQLKRATHKVKTTLAILGDDELSQLVVNIREKALAGDHADLLVMTQQYDVMTSKITEQLIDTARRSKG